MQKLSMLEHESGHAGGTRWARTRMRPIPAAAALAALAAVAVIVMVMTASRTPAYALEQSVEAAGGVRSIHMKMEPPTAGSVGEVWAQFTERGVLERIRMNYPDTEDGPKDVIWEDGKAEVWFKAKGGVAIVREPSLLDRVRADFGAFDPKAIVEGLYRSRDDERVHLETVAPADANAPIRLSVTVDGAPGRKDVYLVDPESKLLLRHEVYRVSDGAYGLQGSTDYLEYNEPIDPEVFTFDLPPHIVTIDQTTQAIGLEQGRLSDEEIALQVVREFFEALIAKDYVKASPLMEGVPPEQLEKHLGPQNVTRILTLGTPEPHEATRSLRVPCTIETEKDGVTGVFEPHGPFVRPVHGQPERWTIIGGV